MSGLSEIKFESVNNMFEGLDYRFETINIKLFDKS
jgi:hypothetical protein